MKALYDAGIMDDVDVISSVSGGGYASYWLYTKYNPSSGEKFGHAAFGNEAFIQSLCELQGNASVFPFKSEIKALFGTRKGAFSSYESALEQSFGNKMVSKPKLDFLKGAIGEARAPYFIINATLRSKKVKNRDKFKDSDKVFELTPSHIGNRFLGFYKWLEEDLNLLTVGRSITISAAGVKS